MPVLATSAENGMFFYAPGTLPVGVAAHVRHTIRSKQALLRPSSTES
jgi:hypothetical protein